MRSLLRLIGGAAMGLSVMAGAQTPATPALEDEIVITSKRTPQAEAPRSATCEAMARDPFFRAVLGTAGSVPMLVPTRMPRNPDYNAPPKVAAGSPLPTLPKNRFGARTLIYQGGSFASESMAAEVIGRSSGDSETAAEGEAGLQAANEETSLESALTVCRSNYQRGAGTTDTVQAESNSRFANQRAAIVARDETLPMAFALFDQGRYPEALEWFRKAERKLQPAEGGDEASLFIGKILLQGLGTASDPAEGVKWLKKTATLPFNPVSEMPMFDPEQPERNTAVGEAAVMLGNIYRNGFGPIAKDPAESRRWYDKAKDVGHVAAAKTLGDIYARGIDTPADLKKAAALYREAATLDHSAAQVALGELLLEGAEGVKQNPKTALGWFNAAAKHDYGPALYALGQAYDFGKGVAPDPEKAIGFYKTAALKGHAPASTALGTYFYEGAQVAKDDKVARQWFEAAAKAADVDAMFNLAAMCAKGEGGPKDMPAALAWMKRAGARGHENAPRAIAALEAKMSPAEKQAAFAMLSRP